MAGNLKAILAELLGTFALVFLGAGSVCMDVLTGGRVGPAGVALAHGLALFAAARCWGGASGGHFNPAVTAAMLIHRRIDPVKGVFYAVAQLFGAALAGLCLRSVLHNHPELQAVAPFLGGCGLADGIGYKAATLVEAIGAFFLLAGYSNGSPALPGAVWAACILAVGPLTGAALNPARAFGPAVVTGHWAHWYVYWIGPLAGAVAAAWLHENLYRDKKRD